MVCLTHKISDRLQSGAVSAPGLETPYNFTVNVTALALAITPTNPSVAIGSTIQLNAEARDQLGNLITPTPPNLVWGGSNAFATVDPVTGVVRGVAEGYAYITVSNLATGAVSTPRTVQVVPNVNNYEITQPDAYYVRDPEVRVGSTLLLGVSVRNVQGDAIPLDRRIEWVSSDTSIAVMRSNRVDGLAVGFVSISAIDSATRYTLATVTVKVFSGRYSTEKSHAIEECVNDHNFGVTWEGKPNGGLRSSLNTYTNWGDGRSGDASTYVAAVNAMALCGYTDWRLPTAYEIWDRFSINNESMAEKFAWFPDAGVVTTVDIWTSTVSGGANCFERGLPCKTVIPSYGSFQPFPYFDFVSSRYRVRLVRSWSRAQ